MIVSHIFIFSIFDINHQSILSIIVATIYLSLSLSIIFILESERDNQGDERFENDLIKILNFF